MQAVLPTWFLIYLIICLVLLFAGLYKMFEKAGVAGWKALIPFYNGYICVKLIGKPIWWFLLLFVPIINAVMIFLIASELAKVYGQDGFWGGVAAMLVPQFYFPYLGFSKHIRYIGPPKDAKQIQKKTVVREWADAIAFAVIAATFIRTFIFEAYTIPTTSMEGTLLAGDFLFVSKINYGPRIPITPIAFPFAHHTMPVTGGKAYSQAIQLPYMRFPGFEKIERNDVVVFNFPEGDTIYKPIADQDYYNFKRQNPKGFNPPPTDIGTRPLDKRENYIKRCVGMPADSLRIINGVLYINGDKAFQADHIQKSYHLILSANLTQSESVLLDFLDDYNLNSMDMEGRPVLNEAGETEMIISMDNEKFEKLKTNSAVKSITPQYYSMASSHSGKNYWRTIFPYSNKLATIDEFGPIWIPKKGATIQLNNKNYGAYKRIIEFYEHNNITYNQNGNPLLDGQPFTEYTFKQNYYFLMGDNRHTSLDSRYWGFVPEDHVVGKASMVWWSWEVNKNIFQKIGSIRWDRVMRPVR